MTARILVIDDVPADEASRSAAGRRVFGGGTQPSVHPLRAVPDPAGRPKPGGDDLDWHCLYRAKRAGRNRLVADAA